VTVETPEVVVTTMTAVTVDRGLKFLASVTAETGLAVVTIVTVETDLT